ncbi:MAG: sulfatase-like hydrolase/transferase [Bryobacterales bacterium]|nr:sulfatase-like hydrolase/transferase [Bryobacterales bacterium]
MAVPHSRRKFLQTMFGGGGVMAGAFATSSCASREAGSASRPNILFLFTDDQRFDTLQALNNPAVKTPNLDRLVKRGTAFTQAHIMGGTIPAVCSPSRAMLLTGQTLFHIDESIVRPKPLGEQTRAPKPFHLFPEVFRNAGYRTFGTGKWHNGPALYARCFDDGDKIMFGGMSDHRKVPIAEFDPSGEYPQSSRGVGEKFSSEMFSDAAIAFLGQQKGDKPFLAYVSYTSPHDPRMAPAEYAAMYPRDSIAVPVNFMPEHPFDNGEMRIRDEMLGPFPRTEDFVKGEIAGYYAMISEVDAQIGRVLDALDASGQVENTIVIFAGDNGLAVGQHGLLGKQSMYEHSIRVPMVLAGPGIPAGETRDAMVYLSDLFATMCDLAGLSVPDTVEGSSLLPVIRNHTKLRDSIFVAYRDFQRCVKTERWKLILHNVKGTETVQLFDMQDDPQELRNLASLPEHATTVAELRQQLAAWMQRVDDPLDISKPDWSRPSKA